MSCLQTMMMMIMMMIKLALRKTLQKEGRKKDKTRLTYSCDNQFLTNTFFVIVNIYLNNRCIFSFLYKEYSKNNTHIVRIH